MTGGIVIPKETRAHPLKVPERRKRMVIQNGTVSLEVQSTRNGDGPYHTKKYTHTSSELHSWHNTFWQEAFYRQMRNPDPAILTV